MSMSKIAITLDEKTLKRLDRLVKGQLFPNRSRAIQLAVEEKLISGTLEFSAIARNVSI